MAVMPCPTTLAEREALDRSLHAELPGWTDDVRSCEVQP